MTINNDSQLQSSFGEVFLQRTITSSSKQETALKAWNAADEYLLATLFERIEKNNSILILNDNFGALSTSLHNYRRTFISDSLIAHSACKYNLELNHHKTQAEINFYDCLNIPEKHYDFIILQTPKTLALLEDQLYRLRNNITTHTQIIATGMAKNIHNSTIKLFEKILGTTHTSLAKKKARLIFCQPEPENWQGASPYPSSYAVDIGSTACTHELINHANVFSRASIDIGAHLFIKNIHKLPQANSIIDLACGNGILGIYAQQSQNKASVCFYDESYMAIASSEENYGRVFPEKTEPNTLSSKQFFVGNSLECATSNSADLILNNPPFHQQHTIGDYIAWKMFNDARRVLKTTGELWVVGNRHLNYHTKLKKVFGNCTTVDSNKKFILLKAVKT